MLKETAKSLTPKLSNINQNQNINFNSSTEEIVEKKDEIEKNSKSEETMVSNVQKNRKIEK